MTIRYDVALIVGVFFFAMKGIAAESVPSGDARIPSIGLNIDPVLYGRLLGEGMEGWNRIRADRMSLELFGRDFRTGSRVGNDPIKITNTWRLKNNGDSILVERVPKQEAREEFQPAAVFGLNDRYAFALTRPGASNPWNVQNVMVYEDEAAREQAAIGVFDYRSFLEINTALGLVSLPELVRDPGFKLKGLQRLTESGRELVKMTFEFEASDGERKTAAALPPSPMSGGWAVLDPANGWGLRSFEIALKQPGGITESFAGSIDYAPTLGSEGRTGSMRGFTTRQFRNNEYEYTTKVDFEEMKYREVGPEEFTLAAYDLPEPGAGLRPRGSRGYVWPYFAVLLVIVGAVVYKYARQRRAAFR